MCIPACLRLKYVAEEPGQERVWEGRQKYHENIQTADTMQRSGGQKAQAPLYPCAVWHKSERKKGEKMTQFVAGIVVALALYGCICLGAEEDRRIKAHLLHRKGESAYGTGSG